jgi:beta-galactosidase
MALTKKYGFKILFRPGPYVCAEWDFGGLPARLLANRDL